MAPLIPPITVEKSGQYGKRHKRKLKAFLQGDSKDTPLDLTTAIYGHCYSSPASKSAYLYERDLAFSSTNPEALNYAHVAISCWMTRIIGERVHREIGLLTADDGTTPYRRVKHFKERVPLSWYLTECMAGPRKAGKTVVRIRRSNPIVQFAAISAFVSARNQYANGHFAAVAGIWHIACKSHIDVKRLYSRMGLSIHDTSAREALETLADDALRKLRDEVGFGFREGRVLLRWVLDNTQRFAEVYKGGAARKNTLICGTACTCIFLDDCDSNAFNLLDYLSRLLKNERANVKTLDLFKSINWSHIRGIQALHSLRTLCHFVPPLSHYLQSISERLRSPGGFAIHRMRDGRKTRVQPLGTNSEKEMETAGMTRCLHDFFSQSGIQPEHASKHIFWVSGDGSSVLSMERAKNYLATHVDPSSSSTTDYDTLSNLLPIMELWHAKQLAKIAGAAKFKRPSNFRDTSNYYSLCRSMGAILDAQFLDCWKILLGLSSYCDLIPHFEKLRHEDKLPSFETLLNMSEMLIDCYATPRAYDQALSSSRNNAASDDAKFPVRPMESNTTRADMEVDDAAGDSNKGEGKKGDGYHKEKAEFDGDCVLANSILFKFDYSLWIEVAYAISDGDIGRAFEVMKVWMFMFAGSGNNNYRNILLELWSLFKYESSTGLKDAIWNNWLVNLTGKLGKWIPADLMQEHYNRWLEDHVGKSGMAFDDPFLRKSISPNVDFFLVLKKELELAFDLHKRPQAHTSLHLRDEFRSLLRLFDEESFHYFTPSRSLGHAAVNFLGLGYEKLNNGVLTELLNRHSSLIDVLKELRDPPTLRTPLQPESTPNSSPSPSTSTSQTPIPPKSSDAEIGSDHESESGESECRSWSESERVESDDEASRHPSSDESKSAMAGDDTTNEDYSRLELGPETMPEIDEATGELIQDWMNEGELDEEFWDIEDEDDEEAATNESEEAESSVSESGSESDRYD
ncbi:hypothetical protein PM082_024860 [Marasmius tenuissimus]|nr:hypothetical protein PM082_024860 [Marasmius tenuissimus]